MAKIQFNILDGQIGGGAGFPEGAIAVTGVAEMSAGEILSFSGFDTVKEKLGNGPLTDFMEDAFSLAKQPVIYALPISGSIPGTITQPVKSGTGVGALSVSGLPKNNYSAVVVIDQAGSMGNAVFHLELNGQKQSRQTIPASGDYEIPQTGITLTFTQPESFTSPLPFEAGDTYSFTTTAAKATNSELLDAVNLLLNTKSLKFSIIAVAQETEKSVWAALGTLLESKAAENRFLSGVCQTRKITDVETPDQFITALCNSERGNFTAPRLQVCAGHCWTAASSGNEVIRPLIGKYCAWLAAMCNVQERPGKVKLGAVTGITGMFPSLDESQIEQLETAGYMALCEYNVRTGYYFTAGRTLTDATSDFKNITNRRVMDKAMTLVYEKIVNYLNDDVDVSKKDGSPENLAHMRADLRMPLKEMERTKEISGFALGIPPGQNILLTETLEFKLGIVPKGYTSIIVGTIYFKNPAIEE